MYTASGPGNLSTSNTAANMPPVAVGTLNDMQTSMAGDYLAVAGTGLQIFKFNGENPVTQLTGLLTSSLIDQVAWDKANHVYAISKSDGKLLVFTVSPAGAVQAPGSPYTLSSPVNLAILPTN